MRENNSKFYSWNIYYKDGIECYEELGDAITDFMSLEAMPII
jgi:hypothetical protein